MVSKPVPKLIGAAPACVRRPSSVEANSALLSNVSANSVSASSALLSNVSANSVAVNSGLVNSAVVESAGAGVGAARYLGRLWFEVNTNFAAKLRKGGRNMNSETKGFPTRGFRLVAFVAMLALAFFLGCSKKEAATTAAIPQRGFATPAEAGQAL